MNRNAYVGCIRLLGKLVLEYNISPDDYRGIERELLEQAIRDNAFYASTDAQETGQSTSELEAGTKRKPGRPPKGH